MATMTPADVEAIKGAQSGFQSGQADAFVMASDLFQNNPSYLGQFYNRNNRKMTTLAKIRNFFPGRLTTSPSSSPIIGHYEGIQMRDTVKISAIAAGATANQAVLTIDDADVYTETVDGAPAPVTRTRPRVKDTIEAVAGGDRYVVIAKSADQKQITIQSFSGDNPNVEIAAGAIVKVGAPITSEGTDSIAPLRKLRARYTNRFWISPENDVVTGSHLTSRGGWYYLPDGRIYVEGIQDAEIRSEYNKSEVWLLGKEVAQGQSIGMYSDPLKENTYLSGTQGLLDYSMMLGEIFDVPASGMTIDDFYFITNILHDLGLGIDVLMGILGSGLNEKIERGIQEYINYTWVIGVSDQYIPNDAKPYWGNTPEQIQGGWVNLGINGFEVNGVKFLKTAAPEFNDARGGGAIGYKEWGLWMPFGYMDTMDQGQIPRLGYEYRGVPGYSRENELYVVTGAGNSSILTGTKFNQLVKSSEWDAAQFYLRWEIAPHFAGGDQFLVMRPGA